MESAFKESMGLDKTDSEKQKIENRKLVPFVDFWDFIIKNLKDGEKKCFMALAKTIKDFSGIRKVRFVAKPQKAEFNGYLETGILDLRTYGDQTNVTIERDEQVANLLKNDKLASLVQAYLAYLITKDIERMSNIGGKNSLEKASILDSEREFAYFRPERANHVSLFRDGVLNDYVPKFATLEYFFTGLFVKNLLYVETRKEEPKIEQKVIPENNDYKIEVIE